jgi:hypothetical protein
MLGCGGGCRVYSADLLNMGTIRTFMVTELSCPTCQAHGACFNLGEDAEGNTLISWSALHALYTLPDGGIWAEHSDFIDRSDMVRLAMGKPM